MLGNYIQYDRNYVQHARLLYTRYVGLHVCKILIDIILNLLYVLN